MTRSSRQHVRSALLCTVALALGSVACTPSKGNPDTEKSDVANGIQNPSSLPRIKLGGLFGLGATEAVIVRGAKRPHKGSIVMSPGAKIPVTAMLGLASEFAREGYVVYVVEYLLQLPIVPTESGKALALAKALRTDTRKVQGLPKDLVEAHEAGLAVSLFGHSMGGTVLANASKEGSSFDLKSIVLFGVSKLATQPTDFAVPVKLLRGEKDGLMSLAETEEVESSFQGQAFEVVKGVNHFCIIDDPRVGDEVKRREDLAKGGPVDLSVRQCQEAVVRAALGSL